MTVSILRRANSASVLSSSGAARALTAAEWRKLLAAEASVEAACAALVPPTARQTNWLLIIALLAVGQALYIRYMALEYTNVSLACRRGLELGCAARSGCRSALFNHEVFGVVALVAALLNLLRPSLVLTALALAAAGFGVVLHNADLSALAAGVLDPQPGAARARTRMNAKPSRPAQSQTACQLAKVSLSTM